MTDTAANRAAWCEVLEIAPGDRVLVVSDEPTAARGRLERMGATVRVDDSHPNGWDLVVVERPAHLDLVVDSWEQVTSGGQLVIVTDNRLSPLRWLDARTGSPGGPAVGSLSGITSALAEVGATHTQVFGLLRGSASSPTVFRTDLPGVGHAVLAAAAANSGRLRRSAVNGLAALAARGRSTPVLPAWMIVATDHHRSTGPSTPTGRIGVELNAQGIVVLGPGPDGLEKFYRDPAARNATAENLATLAQVGFTAAPRIIDEPSPSRLRLQWIPGTDIDANNLPVDQLESWLRKAGSLLGELQRRTLADDGTVLVHGDLWLGAMVAKGERVAAIIDWDDSHRGDPSVDMRTLVAVARDRDDLTDRDRERLIAAAYDAHRQAGGPERARAVP